MTWSQPLSAENLIVRTHGQMGETEAQRGNRFTQWVGLELRLRSLVAWTLSPVLWLESKSEDVMASRKGWG